MTGNEYGSWNLVLKVGSVNYRHARCYDERGRLRVSRAEVPVTVRFGLDKYSGVPEKRWTLVQPRHVPLDTHRANPTGLH